MIYSVFSIITPIFLLLLTGWLFGKKKWISIASLKDINKLLFNLAIPSLLFYSIARVEFSKLKVGDLFLSYYIPLSIVYISSLLLSRYFLKKRLSQSSVIAMASSFSNNVMVALPILIFAWGEEISARVFILLSIHAAFLWIPTVILIEKDLNGRILHPQAFVTLLKNPIILALMSGVLWNLLPLGEIPDIIGRFLRLMSQMASPLALFALGLNLSRFPLYFRNAGDILLINLFKVILLPTLVWGMSRFILHLDGFDLYVPVCMAAAPIGVNVYILASQYHILERRIATAFVVSLLTSFPIYCLILLGFFSGIL